MILGGGGTLASLVAFQLFVFRKPHFENYSKFWWHPTFSSKENLILKIILIIYATRWHSLALGGTL